MRSLRDRKTLADRQDNDELHMVRGQLRLSCLADGQRNINVRTAFEQFNS